MTTITNTGVTTTDLTVDTSTIKVDSTNNHVGFGTATPQYPIDATLAAGGDFVARFQNTTNATPYNVHIKDAPSGANGYPLLQVTDDAGTGTYFRVDSGTAAVTAPNQPCACITGVGAASSTGAEVTVRYVSAAPTVRYNIGGHMDVSTSASTSGRFTCPVAGYYLCIASWYAGGSGSGYMGTNVYKNGSAFGQYWYNNSANYSDDSTMCSIIIKANANDYLEQKIYAAFNDGSPACFFQVHLLH